MLILHHSSRRNNTRIFEEDIVYHRSPSPSPPPRHRSGYEPEVEAEADYYQRKVAERAYIGEAYNGATKRWEIVDVPPGTKRVTMDGVGGASQEVTWQRYNGVRRSRFVADDVEYAGPFGSSGDRRVARPRSKEMWTEITKDLVLNEAIDSMGYEYEETEYFFYVMDYLRYVSFPVVPSGTD